MTEQTRYDGAAAFLPPRLKMRAEKLLLQDKDSAEEIRLRAGRQPSVLLPDGEISLGGEAVTHQDLSGVLDIATGASAHSARESVKNGYITVKGGYRIGLCGTVLSREREVTGFKTISSVIIRISREVKGAASDILAKLVLGGEAQSTLIISPPGGGKTTLLRDIVRSLSDGVGDIGIKGMRISLADERSEIAAMYEGVPQLDVGRRTDILDACPKAFAVMMLLRSANPQMIALDEITAPEDIRAIEMAANCGVKLLATAHAHDISDLYGRNLYRQIVETGIFENIVTIKKDGARRRYFTEEVKVIS